VSGLVSWGRKKSRKTDRRNAFYSRGINDLRDFEKSTSRPPPNETKRIRRLVLPTFRADVDAFSVPFSRASFRNVLFFLPLSSLGRVKFEGVAPKTREGKKIYAAVFEKQLKSDNGQRSTSPAMRGCRVSSRNDEAMRACAFYVQLVVHLFQLMGKKIRAIF